MKWLCISQRRALAGIDPALRTTLPQDEGGFQFFAPGLGGELGG